MSDPSSTTGPVGALTVVCSDEQDDVDVDVDRWQRLAAAVLADLADLADGGELTLTFVDRVEMAALNAEHMGERGPTDVLSFPLDAVAPTGRREADGDAMPTRLLGDVVVCPAVAVEQAADHAGTIDDELALLVVHGILHVLGRDHVGAASTDEMRAEERNLLSAHHWHGPAPLAFGHDHAREHERSSR